MRLAIPADAPREIAPQRLQGHIRIEAEAADGQSRLRNLRERGGFRARIASEGEVCESYLINPAGGLTGGDVVCVDATAGSGAHLVISTAAAERVYRSSGQAVQVNCRLAARAQATLEWLPQQTIFYEGCRFARSMDIEVHPSARVTVLEAIALGRPARGERLENASIRDNWRVSCGGRLVLAESLRLLGNVSRLVERRAVGNGALAAATLVHIGPGSDHELKRVRSCLDSSASAAGSTPVFCGATAIDGAIIARWLASDAMSLLTSLRSFLAHFRGKPAPRGW